MNTINRVLSLAVMLAAGAMLVNGHNLTVEQDILNYKFTEEFKKDFPYYLSGHDEEGAPIWVFEFGKWDLRSYVERGGEDYNNVDIYGDQMFLTFRESARNSTAKHFIGIMDLAGWSVRQASHLATVTLILSKFSTFEKITREQDLKIGFFVNANFLWERILQLGLPLLGSLAQYVEVYGTNKESWIPKLLRIIPKDQLPEWYGGSKDWSPIKVLG